MKRTGTADLGFTLAEILAALMVLVISSALLIPAVLRASRHERITVCAGNLRALHRAWDQDRAEAPSAPVPRGKEFWLRFARGERPCIGAEVLRCPLADLEEPGECLYLGPVDDPAAAAAENPIGCDQLLNHSPTGREGGNVVLKSGAVVVDHRDIWLDAHRRKCRP